MPTYFKNQVCLYGNWLLVLEQQEDFFLNSQKYLITCSLMPKLLSLKFSQGKFSLYILVTTVYQINID